MPRYARRSDEAAEQGDEADEAKHIGASQLIPGVGQTIRGGGIVSMTLRAVLVVTNLCAWGTLVALRGPLPESFFVERDTARQDGGFLLSSSDPMLVIAGRPLRQWSQFHGGERVAVKLLEVANVVPLCTIWLIDGMVGSGTRMHVYTQSVFTFGGLLLLTSAQWWIAGTAVARFRAWRQERDGAVS